MAEILSEDLRGRVIAAVEAGATRHSTAERFGIGVATAIRLGMRGLFSGKY